MIKTKVPKLVGEFTVKEKLQAIVHAFETVCTNGTQCVGDANISCDNCLFQSTRTLPVTDMSQRVDDLYRVLQLWSTISREGEDE